MKNDLDEVAYLIVFVFFYKYLLVLPTFPIMNVQSIIYPATGAKGKQGVRSWASQ